MCRLFGWAGPRMSAEERLGSDVENLISLSTMHCDGWGVAWSDGGVVRRQREARAAHESELFRPALHDAVGEVGAVHLRWATGDLSRRLANTHPFASGDVAFIHNGALPIDDALLSLIDPDLAEQFEGDTDSERYFLAVVSALRSTGDVAAAFSSVISRLDAAGSTYSSLNAMWVESGRLIVVQCHEPSRRAATHPEDYYYLNYRVDDMGASIWSTGVRDGGTAMPNRSVLIADTTGTDVDIVAL
jgi:predicted glutamine amidotransferase